jgi:hypothetical protein
VPYIVFKDLWHGWEAVSFQKSNGKSFSASCKALIIARLATLA